MVAVKLPLASIYFYLLLVIMLKLWGNCPHVLRVNCTCELMFHRASTCVYTKVGFDP